MNRKTLLKAFKSRLRYRNARGALKPLVNPLRFVRNQWRKFMSMIDEPATSLINAFHCRDFKIVDGEWVSEEIAGYGIYEPELTWVMLHLVKPNDVVIDVGMHLGYYSTLFAVLVGSGGKVHAFEPTPTTRALASANVERFPQIRVWHEALWSEDEVIILRDYGLKWMAFNGAKTAKLPSDMPEPIEIHVNCETLDHFSKKIRSSIQLIKIDAESAELEILKGGVEVLKEMRPLISLEVGDGEEEGTSRKALAFALEQGYGAWEIEDWRLVPHRAKDRYGYGNLILAPHGWTPPWH